MFQVHLTISGNVQGVFYRASCQKVAQELDLKGWVKNLANGNVEALAQGEKGEIEKLIEWCKKGPENARVDNVKVSWGEPKDKFSEFVVC